MVKYKSKKEVAVVAIFSNLNTFIYLVTAPERLVTLCESHQIKISAFENGNLYKWFIKRKYYL